MSRSRRQSPVLSIAVAESDKWWKVAAHRINRVWVRSLLANEDWESARTERLRRGWVDWHGTKDGRQWYERRTMQPEWWRK